MEGRDTSGVGDTVTYLKSPYNSNFIDVVTFLRDGAVERNNAAARNDEDGTADSEDIRLSNTYLI